MSNQHEHGWLRGLMPHLLWILRYSMRLFLRLSTFISPRVLA